MLAQILSLSFFVITSISAQQCPALGCAKVKNSIRNDNCPTGDFNKATAALIGAANAILYTAGEREASTNTFKTGFNFAFGRTPTAGTRVTINNCLANFRAWAAGNSRKTVHVRCDRPNIYAGFQVLAHQRTVFVGKSFLSDQLETSFRSKTNPEVADPISAMVHEMAHALCSATDKTSVGDIRFGDETSYAQFRDSFAGRNEIGLLADAYKTYVLKILQISGFVVETAEVVTKKRI